jgi:hypothetical protein
MPWYYDAASLKAVFDVMNWDYELYFVETTKVPIYAVALFAPAGREDARKVETLRLSAWERFGNSVIQLSNAAAIVKKYGISKLLIGEPHPFFDVSRLSETLGIPVEFRAECEVSDADGVVLSGRFFLHHPHRLFSGVERQSWIDAHVQPLLPQEFSQTRETSMPGVTTVHFRGGDIFTDCIHPGYGQPPLAYYKCAVEASNPERVVVVTEDFENPVVEPFLAWVKASGWELVLQSSNLRDDLLLLFGARALVSGRGSFLWAVHALSRNLEHFYYFQWPFEVSPLSRSGITSWSVTDATREYVRNFLHNNWANSPEQRAMMLEYPAENLKVARVERFW